MTKAVDRATAFVNEISGAGTYKIVCKASNHDVAGPKKKHVDCKCLVFLYSYSSNCVQWAIQQEVIIEVLVGEVSGLGCETDRQN